MKKRGFKFFGLSLIHILRREMNLDQAGDKLLDMMFQTIAGRMTAAEALKQNQFVMTRLYESA